MSPVQDVEPRHSPGRTTSPADGIRLSRLLRGLLGIDLPPSKAATVHHKLSGRIRQLGLATLGEYLDVIEGSGGRRERDILISAATTNVTQFFREAHHFEFLELEVLPALVARARQGARIRVWSAGCSTGQEPYSLAACILALCPEARDLDVRILATDVDQQVLGQAEQRSYPAEELQQLSPCRQSALFGHVSGAGPAIVRDEVSSLVTFNRLNLIDNWPMRRGFDIIFCRNVAIYLDRGVRERLWRRFADALNDAGYLIIGHSERVLGPALDCLEHVGITAYRKRAARPSVQP
ncbi:protein-glutamate O-methyltransferase CheR [Rubellimicrobium arenae]|uniref:protein-glutamate O-methyltransferase CheR n=1 Tax=Rubellimicrobium arenae TaxID=2817372 RepID=UPI0034A4FE77